MDILSSAVLGGILWDGIKAAGTITSNYLKHSLKNWILQENDYKSIAKIINEADPIYKKTDKFVNAFIDDNEAIKEILSRAKINLDNRTIQVNQTIHENTGINFGEVQGNVNVYNKKEESSEKKY